MAAFFSFTTLGSSHCVDRVSGVGGEGDIIHTCVCMRTKLHSTTDQWLLTHGGPRRSIAHHFHSSESPIRPTQLMEGWRERRRGGEERVEGKRREDMEETVVGGRRLKMTSREATDCMYV